MIKHLFEQQKFEQCRYRNKKMEIFIHVWHKYLEIIIIHGQDIHEKKYEDQVFTHVLIVANSCETKIDRFLLYVFELMDINCHFLLKINWLCLKIQDAYFNIT